MHLGPTCCVHENLIFYIYINDGFKKMSCKVVLTRGLKVTGNKTSFKGDRFMTLKRDIEGFNSYMNRTFIIIVQGF